MLRVATLSRVFGVLGRGGWPRAADPRAVFPAAAAALLAGMLTGLPVQAQSDADPLRLAPIRLVLDEPSYIDASAGVYDLIGDHDLHKTFGADIEFRYGKKILFIGPAVGAIASIHGGGMVYGGLYSDIAFGSMIVTPLAGIGAAWRGDRHDEDLGGVFQFRLSLAAAYQFDNGSRLGLRFGHISSAGINKRNPGENDLFLIYSLPLYL